MSLEYSDSEDGLVECIRCKFRKHLVDILGLIFVNIEEDALSLFTYVY